MKSDETDTTRVQWICISRVSHHCDVEANGESSSTNQHSLTGKRKERSPSLFSGRG